MPATSNIRRACGLVLLSTLVSAARAELPLWELGAGVGGLRVPHYRGSDQNHHWLLPVPYFVYRGDVLKSDRDGTRAMLLDTERVDVDLSLDASPPLQSSDNRARAGMPDQKATLEVGPKLNLRLAQGSGWKLHLRLPVRAAFTLEGNPKSLGWTTTPELDLDLQWRGWNLGFTGGPLAATRRFHGYFYSVAPTVATPERPAYQAPGGLAGWGLAASATRRLGPWWLAGGVRVDTVSGASFVDSPLVRQRHNVSLALALSYVFAVSDARVPDPK